MSTKPVDSADADVEPDLDVEEPDEPDEPEQDTDERVADAPDPAQRRRNLRAVLVAAFIVVVLDHLTKWWAVSELADRDIDLFWTFRLRLLYNTGTAFSLGSGFGQWIAVLGIVVVIALVAMGRLASTRNAAILIGCVAGGAVGNLLDRAFRDADSFLGGRVVDFFDVQWWPVFNVADIAISVGGVLLVLNSMRQEQRP